MNYAKAAAELRALRREWRELRIMRGTESQQDLNECYRGERGVWAYRICGLLFTFDGWSGTMVGPIEHQTYPAPQY